MLEWDGPLSVLLQRDNPFSQSGGRTDGIANHYHQYVRGREAFLAGPYDAMLIIESDIIPPPDTIHRLVALDADVAYGTYVFRQVTRKTVNVFRRYKKRARNPGSSLSAETGMDGKPLWIEAYEQGIVDCAGAGFGCVLVKRHVLEQVPMRLVPNSGHCDTPWTKDVYSAGFTMRADCRLFCGHIDEDGAIYFPPIPE
jgi:hypothetical protein